jgi:radical SAM protein with 4Fe4S-binding SPASM domain
LSSVAAEPPRRFVSAAAQARVDAIGRTAVRERIPLNGSIAMSHRCQLRCVHCYLGEERYIPPKAAGELPTSFWLDVVDQLTEAGCLNLLMSGGEVFLRRDFSEVYEHAMRRGLLVTVFTNGNMIDDRVVTLFTEWPPQLVEVSLYGATAEVYDKVTGMPGSYARCMQGIDRLQAAGVTLGLKTVILRDNHFEVARMREMARERGVGFRVDPAIAATFAGDLSPLEQRIPAAEAVAIEMQDETMLDKAAELLESKRGLAGEARLFNCLAGVTSFHVDPRGLLLPCLMVQDGRHGYDLRSGNFRAGWEAIAGFHDQGTKPGYKCHDCDVRFLCSSCPAQSALETGSPHKKSDYYCGLGEARLVQIAVRRPGRGAAAAAQSALARVAAAATQEQGGQPV